MTKPPIKPINVRLPKSGQVTVTVNPTVTEQEIVEERETIIFGLHSSYLLLVQEMAEFQREWDKNPALAFIDSARAGFSAGGASWLNDQAELFERETWVNLGGKIMNMAGAARDTLEGYSRGQYNKLEAELVKHASNPGETVLNWAWWQTTIEAATKEKIAEVKAVGAQVEAIGHSVLSAATTAQKIYKHREAILRLPELIAKGDPKPVQAFVEKELMDIDKELATAIRNDKNFAVVLELIADHDTALTYLSYVGLMFEAVPPNFYAYAAGKGGAYLMIEAVLLVVTALLSAGAGVAARIPMLVARFATAGAKVASTSAKLRRAQSAVAAFTRGLESFARAAEDSHKLAAKILKARGKPAVAKGSSKTTLKMQKESIKRDKKCRVCGGTDHVTPTYRLGTVEYR